MIMIIAHNNWMSMGNKNYSLHKSQKLANLSPNIAKILIRVFRVRYAVAKKKRKFENQEFKRRENLRIWAKMPSRLEAEREKGQFWAKAAN